MLDPKKWPRLTFYRAGAFLFFATGILRWSRTQGFAANFPERSPRPGFDPVRSRLARNPPAIVRLQNGAVLLREPHATHQVGKTRVGPQRVPEWFHFKVAETTGALPISLFEPREGLILLTEPGIDNSERKGRRIPLLRGRLKLFEHAESLTSLTQPRMRVPQKSKGHGPASAQCRVLFQLRQTLSVHSSGDIHLPQQLV